MHDIASTDSTSIPTAPNDHPSPTSISSGAEVGKIPRILQHLLLDTG
jgi:hypothetical protein